MISSVNPASNESPVWIFILGRGSKNEKAAQKGSLTLNILIHLLDCRFFEAGNLGL